MLPIDVLADAAILALIDQRQAYGRWHIQSCWYVVGDFNASMCPLKITDRRLYDRNVWEPTVSVFRRRLGCRPMTAKEAAEYHRSLPCWEGCKDAQYAKVGDWTKHIIKDCTERCKGTAAMLGRVSELLNIPLPTLRKIAERRHNLGRYTDGTQGFPVPSGRRIEARRREKRG